MVDLEDIVQTDRTSKHKEVKIWSLLLLDKSETRKVLEMESE